MAEWKTCTIADLGTVIGGATPSTKKEENYEGGTIAWITPKDLAGFTGRYILRGERNITECGLNSCSAKMMPAHSVLFSSRAPIGYIAIAGQEMCTNQGFKSVVPNDNIDYIKKSIKFAESVVDCKVIAIVLFPMTYSNKLSGIYSKKRYISTDEFNRINNLVSSEIMLPVYILGNEQHMDMLFTDIINFFS